MLIDPQIAAKHWAQAAVDQVARSLKADGYVVTLEERLGRHLADLVARRNGEIIVYEFKVGDWSEERARQAAAVRKFAVEDLGAKFKFVIVTPPREKSIEVAEIEHLLMEALSQHLPKELDQLSSNTSIERVSQVEIHMVSIRSSGTELAGEGVVDVELQWGKGDDGASMTESFPFTYEIVLSSDGRLQDVNALSVDVSGWYGDEADGGTGDGSADR